MEKNGEYIGEVCGQGTDGEGIVRTEGATVFVPFCMPKEKIRFKVLSLKGDVAYGKLLEVLEPSPDRVTPRCPVFEKCGGCALQHMSYPSQLAFKRGQLKASLKKIGNIAADVDEVVPCESEYRYRNKLALPIGEGADGPVCGFYASRSHRIVPILDCDIQFERAGEAIECLRKYMALGVKNLRHFVARKVGESYIFALVCKKKVNPQPLVSLLSEKFSDFTFLLNENPSEGNAIFGDRWTVWRGSGYVMAEERGIKYPVGANTFMQVNDEMREKLYGRVLFEAESVPVAVNLYSGGGLLTAMLAEACGEAYGIEIVKEAHADAESLKKLNGLDGRMFDVLGAVEDNTEILEKARDGMVVCDPPRKGMERSVVKALKTCGAKKIALVSCNPATLARDLGLLLGTLKEEDGRLVKGDGDGEYEISSLTPFDMFPQTKWCETLCVLERKA